MYSILTLVLLVVIAWMNSVSAQSDGVLPINATTIEHLKPVVDIDFADLPVEAGAISNGRVFVSHDGRLLAMVNRDGQVIMLDDTGAVMALMDALLTDDDFPATFIDGAFDFSSSAFAAIHSAGESYFVTHWTPDSRTAPVLVRSANRPVGIWLDADMIWLEVIPQKPDHDPYLLQLPISSNQSTLTEDDLTRLPFAPAQDPDAVVRIGRLPPPLTVTATQDGVVSRWDLSSDERTAVARVDDVPIYGAMTPDGRYLAWRDPASTTLNLLDFEIGENRVVAALDGMYIPFILLAVQGDVIIGVAMDDQPIVSAWMIETGEMLTLGLYRQCGRPPDMVNFSRDGKSLVIGCNTGLQIWRVNDKA